MTLNLLSHTETHAFKSFLSSMEYSDNFQAPEWSMYGDVEELSESIIPHTGQDTLQRAAKSLMSLDALKWGNPPSKPPQPAPQFQNNNTSNDTLLLKQLPLAIAPLRTVSSVSSPATEDVPSASSSPASVPTSASPQTPFEFFQSPPPQHLVAIAKRPSQDDTNLQSNKRPRPTPPQASSPSLHKINPPSFTRASSSSQPSPASAVASGHAGASTFAAAGSSASSSRAPAPQPKPALLSSSQKKANHIQSEQKRRANIRRGYEALCEAVPALREAILAEEAGDPADDNGSANGDAKGRGRKGKGRGRLASEDGEKMDGRAGPRSENVVLQKTIDHIQDLLEDKKDLLARLHAARSALPLSHPVLQSHSMMGELPLWEREWTGGMAAGDDEDEGDDD